MVTFCSSAGQNPGGGNTYSRSSFLLAAPKLTPEFLADFDKFNLTAQEGYLISLIDGRITIDMLLKLSPFDNFTTLFNLAKLQQHRAITIPS